MTCRMCRALEREARQDMGDLPDFMTMKRRRILIHAFICMTAAERAEWLKAGGLNEFKAKP